MKSFLILALSFMSLSLFGESKKAVYVPDENHTPPTTKPDTLYLREAQEAELQEEEEMSQMKEDVRRDEMRDDLKVPNDSTLD